MKPTTQSVPTVNIGVRLEPQFLREIHRIADRKELSVSATARHLMALGLEQLQTAA